jgi:signal transduction histidine kinase
MRRRKTVAFFLILGISLTVLAAALNIGWIILNLREVVLLILGVVFFVLIMTGMILNTIFLVREIRRNEQHDAFLNAVTHELKTPIASIKLYLETLKRRELDEVKRQEFYTVMLADSNRLLGTVEQVLEASRTKEKNRPSSRTATDLAELLTESVGTAIRQHHLGEGAIRFVPPAEKAVVMADRAELRTVFGNLLDNAVKYSGEGPRISVKLRYTPRFAEVYIKDNGKGIARADLKRIFRRFYRVADEDGGGPRGTGLGLSIVRSIVERHGGRVGAESKGAGRGSTFYVRLPIHNA